jgi:capsular exopolysaccharide synthesis family protein
MSTATEPYAGRSNWDAPGPAHQYLRILWQRKSYMILGALVGLALGWLYHAQKSPIYQSRCQLLVIKKTSNPLPVSGGDPRLTVIEDYMATQIGLLRSPLIIERAVRRGNLGVLPSFANNGNPVGAILGGLAVTRDLRDSTSATNNIVHLSYRGPVAVDCGTVLEAIVESYQDFLDTTYRNVSDQSLKLITQARDVLKNELSESEAKYVKFIQDSPFIFRTKEGTNIEQQSLLNIVDKRSQLLIRKVELKDKIHVLDEAVRKGKVHALAHLYGPGGAERKLSPAERIAEDVLLPELLKEQELLEDYAADHPQVRAIRKRIEAIQARLGVGLSPAAGSEEFARRLLEGLRLELQEVETTLGSLEQLLTTVKEDVRKQSNYEVQENKLHNEIERTKLIYNGTIKRLQEIDLSRDSGGYEAQPLARPGLGEQVAPSQSQNLLLGLCLGLMLGAGLVYLADVTDKSFRDPEEIRRRLGLPIVGHIPYLQPDAEAARKGALGESVLDPLLCSCHRPKSLEAEAYRTIRTALYFNAHGDSHRVIQMTSPTRGDGKSLTIANLAVTIAQSGKKVLLIDADCRRPRLHKIFGLSLETGLSTVLSGQGSLSEAVRPSSVPGLSVLASGPIPPNPSELLIAPQFQELVESIRTEYDYVLIDTPPLLAVTDPCVVASRVDGIFLVMRLTRRGRPDAVRAREILAAQGVTVFGVIVNGVSRHKAGIYSAQAYDYTYSYRYYRHDDESEGYYQVEDEPGPGAPTPVPPANGHLGEAPPKNGKGRRLWGPWWSRHS